MRARLVLSVLAGSLCVQLIVAIPAGAAYPGANGKIVFADVSGLSGIYSMNSDGTGLTQLTTGFDDGPVWSPDGTRIAFSRHQPGPNEDQDIWVMNADGSGAVALTQGLRGDDRNPSWSPDGTMIVYSRTVRNDASRPQLFIVGADGLHGRRLTHDGMYDLDPAWAPDGRTIAFIDGLDYGLWVTNLRGKERLVHSGRYGDASPQWSPDASTIVFAKGGPGTESIHTIQHNGTRLTQVTQGAGYTDREPAFSPDGTQIVFFKFPHEIWIVNADGSGARPILSTQDYIDEPDWQPLL